MSSPNGEVIITNDGATILQKMTVTQPAAKMLVELSKSQVGRSAWARGKVRSSICMGAPHPSHPQDIVAGDGTTSVVVICGSLLKKSQELLDKGVHPTVISDSFNKAAQKACEVRGLLHAAERHVGIFANDLAMRRSSSPWQSLSIWMTGSLCSRRLLRERGREC